MKNVRDHIAYVFKLTDEEVNILLSAFTKLELKKNEVFVEIGEVSTKMGLIVKGMMMCVYFKNGNEIIDEFSFEKNFITNYYSYLTNTPSTQQIRCIEDTTVLVLSKERIEELARQYSFIEKIIAMMNEKLYLITHERLKSFLLDSAPERYLKLISQRQGLAQRIPQYLIASYLRVKPETISRIRKKISNGDLGNS